MRKIFLLGLVACNVAFAAPDDEWEPYRKTGLFSQAGGLWIAPNMEQETVQAYTVRLLDGARQDDMKAMATLGRFFYVRGQPERAAEWLEKAAESGHAGAQFDYGMLCQTGQGVPKDLVEAYKWLWLATWADVPGADAMLRDFVGKVSIGIQIVGVQRAAAFQETHVNAAKFRK